MKVKYYALALTVFISTVSTAFTLGDFSDSYVSGESISIDFPTEGYMRYGDSYRLYGSSNESYAIYYKKNEESSFDVLKKTYCGNKLFITVDGTDDLQDLYEIINKRTNGAVLLEKSDNNTDNTTTITVSDSFADEDLTLKTVTEIAKDLNRMKSIKSAEYISSSVSFQTCKVTPGKYLSSDAEIIKSFIKESKYDTSAVVDETKYDDDHISVSLINRTEEFGLEFYGALHEKTGASYEIVWDEKIVTTGKTIDVSSLLSDNQPIVETDDENNRKIIDELFSSYPDLSDGKKIYVNPKYSVEFVHDNDKYNNERYVVIIYGFDKNNLPVSRDEIFTTNLKIPTFSIWDKIKTPVYSGEIAGGQVNGSYISIVTCVEGELPVKNIDGERMNKEEVPVYMSKHIFPEEYTDFETIAADLYGSVSDITLNLGDLNNDRKNDVTDISSLSLYLIGDLSLSENQREAADIDGDGAVTLADLARLQQYISKKIDSLG